MKVDVYKNLHKKCMSVRSREKDNYGKVVEHTNDLVLKDVEFVVRSTGRYRVLHEGRKNVHAFVRGRWIRDSKSLKNLDLGPLLDDKVQVTYNPYRYSTFVYKTTNNNYCIFRAPLVLIEHGKVWVKHPFGGV